MPTRSRRSSRAPTAVVSAYAPPQDNTDALLGVTERQIAGRQEGGRVSSDRGGRRWTPRSCAGRESDRRIL